MALAIKGYTQCSKKQQPNNHLLFKHIHDY